MSLVALSMQNFTLTLFIFGLFFSLVSWILQARPRNKAAVIEILFSWFLLFNIGLSYFLNFIFHVFFGDFSAQFIGWAQSPFQLEVGFASLGFAVNGLIAFKSSLVFRAATIIAPAMFLWGAAAGHIYQMIIAQNFEPGNAGTIFWTDILIPIMAFILLWLQYKNQE